MMDNTNLTFSDGQLFQSLAFLCLKPQLIST